MANDKNGMIELTTDVNNCIRVIVEFGSSCRKGTGLLNCKMKS